MTDFDRSRQERALFDVLGEAAQLYEDYIELVSLAGAAALLDPDAFRAVPPPTDVPLTLHLQIAE